MAISDPVEAGMRDVVLRTARPSHLRGVAGRCVDRDGAPLPGLELQAFVDVRNTTWGHYNTMIHPTATTDAQGRFEFDEAVPILRASLEVTGDAIVPESVPVESLVGREEIVLVPSRRCHVVIDCPPGLAAEADRVEMRSAAGERRTLLTYDGGMLWSRTDAWSVAEGVSHPLAVAEDAVAAVLLHGDREVRRVPVRLVPGEVVTLRMR
jgi:hypothetical protein